MMKGMINMQITGRTIKYGANVDTDVSIPARYLNTSAKEELAKHCMEDLDPEFINRVKPGDIIIAGPNFGCGSSREHAPIAIKASGIACVIAPSFARIFYRNSINTGLAILECKEAYEGIDDGDEISVDFDTGVIMDLNSNQVFRANAFPAFISEIIKSDGLVDYTKNKLSK